MLPNFLYCSLLGQLPLSVVSIASILDHMLSSNFSHLSRDHRPLHSVLFDESEHADIFFDAPLALFHLGIEMVEPFFTTLIDIPEKT